MTLFRTWLVKQQVFVLATFIYTDTVGKFLQYVPNLFTELALLVAMFLCVSVCLRVCVHAPSQNTLFQRLLRLLVKSRPPNICLQWRSLVLCFCFINLDKIFLVNKLSWPKCAFVNNKKMLTKNVSKIKGLAKKNLPQQIFLIFFGHQKNVGQKNWGNKIC